jgi:NAD(P)-dependent dehydrogenase (short-subunit alcohol dehydrogenase family)
MSRFLLGKVALVTGGSRGIGAATALALADQGADVAISYVAAQDQANRLVAALQAKGVRAAAFKADQGDIAQTQLLVESVAASFGGLNVYVSNAGISFAGRVDASPTSDAELNRMYAVNLHGVVAGIRAAARVIRDHGRIIVVSSGVALRTGSAGLADYTAVKSALVGFSRGAARDLAARAITVNVVLPGFTDTDMVAPFKEQLSGMIETIALRRLARPEEVAAGIVFLASPAASYVTGTTLNIDGGLNA